MVELKFKDIESLNAVTGALRKNSYVYSTFVVWEKGDGGIDCFIVRIEGEMEKKILDVTCGARSIWFDKHHPAAEVWKAIGQKPLFGHHSGKQSRTFWACFMKLED